MKTKDQIEAIEKVKIKMKFKQEQHLSSGKSLGSQNLSAFSPKPSYIPEGPFKSLQHRPLSMDKITPNFASGPQLSPGGPITKRIIERTVEEEDDGLGTFDAKNLPRDLP